MYQLTGSIGVPNYGLAIVFMTIAIKLVLFPLTQKQMKSMRGMQAIQPKLKYIQDRYKDDPQTMQKKVMELYKAHGVNPFGGCLPLVIQMPIFIAFYQSLYGFEFKVAEHAGFLWIPNIGKPDPFFILAILAAVTTYLQQRVSMVDAKDPTQKSMLYFMPLFMAWIAYKMPAGLPLYWVVFNILGILQQVYVNWTDKAQLDTGMGLQVETTTEGIDVEKDNNSDSTEEKVAGRDKGGTKSNGSPNNRKKGKKRR
ncbi:MAG: YidC/Oxa1 family membrane protein insertase [Syntrophomonadaceae bacterium]